MSKKLLPGKGSWRRLEERKESQGWGMGGCSREGRIWTGEWRKQGGWYESENGKRLKSDLGCDKLEGRESKDVEDKAITGIGGEIEATAKSGRICWSVERTSGE